MIPKLLAFLLLWAINHISAAQSENTNVLRLEGIYKGDDVYVKNPFGPMGVGFCSYEVRVNGELSSDEVNSTAFAIDLAQFGLKIGADVIIEVYFKNQCRPQFINPEAIEPLPTFVIETSSLAPSGRLIWTSRQENGKLSFRVEQKKWNKWVKVGEIPGKGSPGPNTYQFQANLHSGVNTFRLVQRGGNITKRSEEISCTSDAAKVQLLFTKVYDKIEFSSETDYELFNSYGEIVAKGNASFVDVRDFKRGIYYLNYDNVHSIEISKK
jgi:hypothetical protein